MIDMTSHTLNSIANLNAQNERISYQMSTGEVLENGSDDAVLYSQVLNIEGKIRTYDGIERQLDKTIASNNVADSSMEEIKTSLDSLKVDLLKSVNAGIDSSSKTAIAVNLEGTRDNLMQIANTTVDGEYIFSGSKIGETTFVKDENFEANGRIDYGGDAVLRTVAVEEGVYRERGTTAFDVLMYNSDTAAKDEQLEFTQRERIIDENNLEWNLTKADKSNKLTFDKNDVILDDAGTQWKFIDYDDSDGDGDITTGIDYDRLYEDGDSSKPYIDVKLIDGNKYQTASIGGEKDDGSSLDFLAVDIDQDGDTDADDLQIRAFSTSGKLVGEDGTIKVEETAGDPNTYKTKVGEITGTRVLEAKHNFFDDLNVMINALKGYATNSDGTKGDEISDEEATEILRNSLDASSAQYDATNVGHAKLGGRNKIFEVASESIDAKQVHYDILLQETNGADLSKLAMESKSLEMTYEALYSTVAKMNSLSLVNYLR